MEFNLRHSNYEYIKHTEHKKLKGASLWFSDEVTLVPLGISP